MSADLTLAAFPKSSRHPAQHAALPSGQFTFKKGFRQPVNAAQRQGRQDVYSEIDPKFSAVAPVKIQHDWVSANIFKFFQKPWMSKYVTREPNWFNLSVNDWLSRLMLIFGLYIPQGLTAIKQKKHAWETNGRNAVIWTGTLALNIFTKWDRMSINTMLDPLMRPKGKPYELVSRELDLTREYKAALEKAFEKADISKMDPENQKHYLKSVKTYGRLQKKEDRLAAKREKMLTRHGGNTSAIQYKGNWIQRQINNLRLSEDYYDLLRKPEIDIKVQRSDRWKAYWSSLNSLDIESVLARIEDLKTQNKATKLVGAEAKELKTLSRFMTQLSTFKLVSTAVMSGLTIYVIGTVLMDLIFKYIAPLDKDFDQDKTPKKVREQMKAQHELEKQQAKAKDLAGKSAQLSTTASPFIAASPLIPSQRQPALTVGGL